MTTLDNPDPDRKSRFYLGQIVSTPGGLELLRRARVSPSSILRRHQSLDPGCLTLEDQESNSEALTSGARILSAFDLPVDEGLTERIWVITEAENDDLRRETTTILLPEEY